MAPQVSATVPELEKGMPPEYHQFTEVVVAVHPAEDCWTKNGK
ncbi:MAG TPA: hypothetical protein VEH10_05315 [Thermoplasmata archaeon]|nr:hypothetical protein [Thermoplasmata archaeon]